MTRRGSTAPEAVRGFRQAFKWLRQPGAGPAAAKILEGLQTTPARLARHPYAGAPSQEHPGARQIVVSGYRLIYEINPDTGDPATAGSIRIMTVLAPGQP